MRLENINECCNLMVVAHPDDETLWGGAHLISKDWFIVCLTNGDNKIRSTEFQKVLDYTGNHGVILSYPDLVNGVKSDWSECEQEILQDLACVLAYKDWQVIVTHNPEGETGHIHHLNINRYMYDLCKEKDLLDHLYYFGRFYQVGKIPGNLMKLPDSCLLFKRKVVALYINEAAPISYFWAHMIPYENWIVSTDWEDN